MSRLAGRRAVVGVCGGIAAYKAVEVCRRLVDAGAHVVPVLTADALRFVGEVTFSAVASEKAHTSMWDGADPIPHTRLGRDADVVVVAPATARFLAAYAMGLSDDLLTATLLMTRAPVLVCPAMHTEMWEHVAVRRNVGALRAAGVRVLEPDVGRLAGGDEGAGRLPEPAAIVAAVEALLAPRDLAGKRVLVTAGGTREAIDPVRFVGNRSSGKQGHALAEEAVARGAAVTLVTAAPLPAPPAADVVRVVTAAEMEAAVLGAAAEADVVVMAAAVADFRPKAPSSSKLDKAEGPPHLALEPTADILAALGARRRPGQVLVGFAAEAGAGALARAEAKREAKGVDLMVVNDVLAPGAGFDHDTNAVTVLGAQGYRRPLPMGPKREVAAAVFDEIARLLGG